MNYSCLYLNCPKVTPFDKPDFSKIKYANPKDVPEDYNDDDFIEKSEDFSFAKICEELIYFLKPNKKDDNSNDLHKQKLCYHLEQFIYNVLDVNFEDTDEKLRFLFSALAYLKMYDLIEKTFNDAYRENLSMIRGAPDTEIFALNYSDIYKKIGDVIFLEEHNIDEAMKFYRFAALDLASDIEGKLDKGEYANLYNSYLNVYKGLDADKIFPEKEHQDIWNSFWSVYDEVNSLLYCNFNYYENASKELLTATDKFFTEYKNKEVTENDLTLYILALKIRSLTLTPTLAYLHDDKPMLASINAKNKTKILSSFSDFDISPSTKCLVEFVKEIKKEPSIDKQFDLLLDFAKYSYTCDCIRNVLLVVPKEPIAFYTSFSTLGYMLWKKTDEENDSCGKFSIMHTAYMNDPNEGKVLDKIFFWSHPTPTRNLKVESTRNLKVERKTASYSYVFARCFTRLIDDLRMWDMYADSSQGVCVLINADSFLQKTDDEKFVKATPTLYNVCYVNKKTDNGKYLDIQYNENLNSSQVDKLNEYIRTLKPQFNPGYEEWFLKASSDLSYLFKYSDFAYEQETRLLFCYDSYSDEFCHTKPSPNDTDEQTLLYVQPNIYPKIQEVILGPKFDKGAKGILMIENGLARLNRKLGLPDSKITKSDIEFQ